MTYKEHMRHNELITKVRIIRSVKKDHIPIGQVAAAFSAHRNTIGHVINAFDERITPEDQRILLANGTNLTQKELVARYGALSQTQYPTSR